MAKKTKKTTTRAHIPEPKPQSTEDPRSPLEEFLHAGNRYLSARQVFSLEEKTLSITLPEHRDSQAGRRLVGLQGDVNQAVADLLALKDDVVSEMEAAQVDPRSVLRFLHRIDSRAGADIGQAWEDAKLDVERAARNIARGLSAQSSEPNRPDTARSRADMLAEAEQIARDFQKRLQVSAYAEHVQSQLSLWLQKAFYLDPDDKPDPNDTEPQRLLKNEQWIEEEDYAVLMALCDANGLDIANALPDVFKAGGERQTHWWGECLATKMQLEGSESLTERVVLACRKALERLPTPQQNIIILDTANNEAKAIAMLQKYPDMAHATSKQWGEHLSIADGTIRKLNTWKARERYTRPRREGDAADIATSCSTDELEALVREQEADDRSERLGRVHQRRM